jgi:acetyl-CoA carboxylase biotin carboxyl carrier protein
MIDQKKLRELVKLMVANDLTELDIHANDQRITIKRGSLYAPAQVVHAPLPPAVAAPAVPLPAAEQDPGDEVSVRSPMVGTFYASPTPDAQPFVSVGDSVGPDTVVCIIEAMKVFNEIKAEMKGVVEKILVANGHAVEFDQPLFLVKPD